ncbi:MAG: tetratricopeptide repeat protein [Bryobacteraceae bacterium]
MPTLDEALTLIRQAPPSNADYLDDLQARLTAAHPIPLVPFIGAGLSMPMGFPSWTDFLTGLAQESGVAAQVAALLSADEYEEAAQATEQALSPVIFNKRITHIFGERKSHECALQGAVLALPDLAGGPVVTTNFDRILERVFREAGSPFEHVVWGSQVDSMRRAMAENKPFLLKIHGDAEERSNRVLTKSEYDKNYAPGDPVGLRAQLKRVFQGRTLLFAGCSLGPDRTMGVLFEVLQEASGLDHFAIFPKPADDEAFHAKQHWLGERGIQPIWYPTGRHELIEPLLRWIATLQPSLRIPAPELVLESPAQRKRTPRSDLDLLIPYQQTTAFVGRQAELDSLQAWLASEAAVSVRVITGGGGSGKTRLAVELLDGLDQWHCGFLTQAEIERFSALQNLSRWSRRKPVLAVVDYAAGSAGMLRTWLEQLSSADHGGEKLRLLLLEREASRDEGWLASTLPRGDLASAVQALFDPPEPVRLDPLPNAADRRQVLQAVIEAAARFRHTNAPKVPAPGADAQFDHRIDEPLWGDPLTLMMAGLTAMETGLAEAMALGRTDLAFRLAKRELGRVERFAHGASTRLMEHMAAYVTLCGGLSRQELREACKTESESIGHTHPSGWGALADHVWEALRVRDQAQPVQPDVVGEALLLDVWTPPARSLDGTATVLRAVQRRGQPVVASVIRSAQDFCVGASPRPEPLAWLDALIAEGKRDLPLLRLIEGELPHQTLALRERAVEVDAALAAAVGDPADEQGQAGKAGILNNLGNRLRDLGRIEDALKATTEAVKFYRNLADQRPAAFLHDMCRSLTNLELMLSDLGRLEKALQIAEEAVSIGRKLASERAELAGALNNLGMVLNKLGRRKDALKAIEEAVCIHRHLVAQRADVNLATSLNNVGTVLRNLGRSEDALEAIEEAVCINRHLVAQRPDAFLPVLAMSLNNLGMVLNDLGRGEAGLLATDEAVGHYRHLAQQRPDAFLPEFATSLNNLGLRLSTLGHHLEALQAIDEAVRIRRQLAAQRPDAFLPGLAMSLGATGAVLRDSGDTPGALAAFREGIECLKQPFLRLPAAFRQLMRNLVIDYIQVCKSAGAEPDLTLLADIIPVLSDDQSNAAET